MTLECLCNQLLKDNNKKKNALKAIKMLAELDIA
jgi:hypothetical protein